MSSNKVEVKLNLPYKPRIVIGVSTLTFIKTFFVNQLDALRHTYGDLIEGVMFDTIKPIDFCLDENTFIHTTNGTKRITDIGEGDMVLTHKGRYMRVYRTGHRNYDDHMYTIRTANSCFPITATKEHPFFVVKVKNIRQTYNYKKWKEDRLESPRWVTPEEMKEGDYLLSPVPQTALVPKTSISISDYVKNITVDEEDVVCYEQRYRNGMVALVRGNSIRNTQSISPELMRLFGYYVAEGYANGSYISFTFNSKETKYINDVKACAKQTFGFPSFSTKKYDNGNALSVAFNSKAVSEFFITLFGKGARQKKLPDWFLELPLPLIIEFVKGYQRGDGYVMTKKNSSIGFNIATASRSLAVQVGALLLKLGVTYSMHQKKSKITAFTHHNIDEIAEMGDSYGPIYHFDISGWSADALATLFEVEHKPRSRSWNRTFIKDGYWYLPIKKIEKKLTSTTVYNLDVEEDESFVAENFAVHNSRNAIFARFLMEYPYATHLWILDDDVLVPSDSIIRLIENDLPVVSGMIVQKKPPFYPLMNVRVAPDSYRFAISWDATKRYIPVDACGLGNFMIRRDAVQMVQPPWCKSTGQSEDFWLCERLQQYGFPIVIDTFCQNGHVGDYIYSLNDFQQYNKNELEKSKSYHVTVGGTPAK